jgi:inorganic pyrophosphatase
MSDPFSKIPAYDKDTDAWHAVIETPKGSHNKFDFDQKYKAFSFGSVLPQGMSFPYDFGFIPSTLGDDGDPLDVMLLMDEPAFPGCLVPVRLIGVIEARQTERDGKSERNDRLVAVPIKCRTASDCKTIKDLNDRRVEEIAEFFVSYNRVNGKKFEVLGVKGPKPAETLVKAGMKKFEKAKGK